MAADTIKIKGGLRKIENDPRDIKLGALFPSRVKVPDIDFVVGETAILDQKDTDACTAHSTSAASSMQEGVVLEPAYIFAKTKQLLGEWESWGADNRTACLAHTKIGAIEKDKSPFNLESKSRDFVANWNNWDSVLDFNAILHRKRTFIRVDDDFDSIREALWKFRDEKRAVVVGAVWRPEWTYASGGIIPKEYGQEGFGHSFLIVGQKMIEVYKDHYEPHLVAQLSNGVDIGDKGYFYFPKEVVNKEFLYGGSFMFIDMPKEDARTLVKYKLSARFSWLARVINSLGTVVKRIEK